MRPNIAGILLLAGLLASAPDRARGADAKAKINFQDQVSAIFKNRCNACHNADKQKGGLNLETFGGAMQGGGSGKVVEPGDADASTLFQLVSHTEQPNMPPNAPKIPDAEIATIKAWIEGGALETSGSMVAVKAKPKFEFKLDAEAAGKPVGPPAMPENLSTEPAVVSTRPNAVIAMASSPWAPLVAVGGHKQVLLYQSASRHLMGVLPFPEGAIHVLKFSRNGGLLLAAGGRGGQSGLAVVWDVKTGKRVFEIGKEYDVVLAADISPDHGMIALGGPSKILRVYNTADGQLIYEQKKHTEWITAVEFSPDGVLLASGDRNNGLLVWEAVTGREFYDLRAHTLPISDISWRLDSNVVASSSEDGTVKLWEMEGGKPIKSISAHPGGAASVRFAKDGRLVTSGRDRMTRLWDPNGNKVRDFEVFNDLALEAVFTHDGSAVVAGDWSGEVRVWDAKDGKRLGNLAANPAPLATRLEQTDQALAAAETEWKKFAPLLAAPAEKAAAVAASQQALAEAEKTAATHKAAVDAAARTVKARSDAHKAALDALTNAQTLVARATATAEKAVADSASASRAAAEKLAAATAATDAARADKQKREATVAATLASLKSAPNRAVVDQTIAALEGTAKLSADATAAVELATVRQSVAQFLKERADAEQSTASNAVAGVVAAAKEQADKAMKMAQEALPSAAAEKAAAEKALADATAAAQPIAATVAARKKDLERATAEKAAVDKALAAGKPAIDAARARLEWLKSERDALALEKKAVKDSRASTTVSANKGS